MMLEKIRIRLAALGILGSKNDTTQDEVLSLMIADTVNAVLLYCHRTHLPEQLEYLIRAIVVRCVQEDNCENVSSIKRGDTQINYMTVITTGSFTAQEVNALNAFRRLRIG